MLHDTRMHDLKKNKITPCYVFEANDLNVTLSGKVERDLFKQAKFMKSRLPWIDAIYVQYTHPNQHIAIELYGLSPTV